MIRTVIFLFLFSLNAFSQQPPIITNTKKEKIVTEGFSAYKRKDTLQVKKTIQQLHNLYTTTNDSTVLAMFYQYKAMLCKIYYKNDSAYHYYSQSKNISKILQDSLEIGRRLLSIAHLQRKAKDYIGSEISSVEALRYLEPIQSNKYLERTYNNLGIVSEELNKLQEALKSYQKALSLNVTAKNKSDFLYIINNIGLVYQREKQYTKALSYFRQGLQLDSIENKYPSQYALLLENLALSNYRLGNRQNVLTQYQKVLSIRKKLQELNLINTTHLLLANYYKDVQQTKKALYHAKQGLYYAKKTHTNKRWLEALYTLSKLTTGKQSNAYLKEYILLNDSLFRKERGIKNQFAKIRYETDKKEKENVVLKTENKRKQAEIVYQKQQKTIGWLLSGISFLILLLGASYFVIRRKKLRYEAELQKIEARDNERQQIAKSLHDEVAGDLHVLHQKLQKSLLLEEAKKLHRVKNNVRNLSHQLSSISFDQVSFEDQLVNLITDYFEPNFKISLQGIDEHNWTKVNNSIKRLLFLSIRESIQNTKKYAKATTIGITLSIHKKDVFLEINDNGLGFNTNNAKKGIGLLNLKERTEELKGFFSIESELGKGTTTTIQIPLHA